MKYSEELRKQILDQIERWPSWRADVMRALLDEIDRLTEQQRWIPVSERLPGGKVEPIYFEPVDFSDYDWPYSNKCPNCHKRKMKGNICTNCGWSGEQKKCPRCGKWMHHGYLDGRDQCTLYCDAKDKMEGE